MVCGDRERLQAGRLSRKHGVASDELPALCAALGSDRAALESQSAATAAARSEVDERERAAGAGVRRRRTQRAAARQLETRMPGRSLAALGMRDAVFRVAQESADGTLGATGIDAVESFSGEPGGSAESAGARRLGRRAVAHPAGAQDAHRVGRRDADPHLSMQSTPALARWRRCGAADEDAWPATARSSASPTCRRSPPTPTTTMRWRNAGRVAARSPTPARSARTSASPRCHACSAAAPRRRKPKGTPAGCSATRSARREGWALRAPNKSTVDSSESRGDAASPRARRALRASCRLSTVDCRLLLDFTENASLRTPPVVFGQFPPWARRQGGLAGRRRR